MSATPHKPPVSQLSLGLERPERLPNAPARSAASPAPVGPGSRNAPASCAFERAGRAIGRDYARHGLMPPADHLHAGHPVREGWEAARQRPARPGQRLRPASLHVQRWLALRLWAWLRGLPFDTLQVTPGLLARIDVSRCPVTRELLTQGAQGAPADHGCPTDAVVVALREADGVVPGNLVVLGRRAARVLAQGLAPQALAELDAPARQRARSLLALATPWAHARARVEPLALVPPARVHVRNPAHALQALLGTLFFGGGYARRMSELGALVPAGAARRAYAPLMSALLARRLEAGWAVASLDVRQTLEDAWLHPRVQRHWQALVGSLSAAQCERIVQRALARGLAAGQARPVQAWADEVAHAARSQATAPAP